LLRCLPHLRRFQAAVRGSEQPRSAELGALSTAIRIWRAPPAYRVKQLHLASILEGGRIRLSV